MDPKEENDQKTQSERAESKQAEPQLEKDKVVEQKISDAQIREYAGAVKLDIDQQSEGVVSGAEEKIKSEIAEVPQEIVEQTEEQSGVGSQLQKLGVEAGQAAQGAKNEVDTIVNDNVPVKSQETKENPNTCPVCGADVGNIDNFCTECGTNLREAARKEYRESSKKFAKLFFDDYKHSKNEVSISDGENSDDMKVEAKIVSNDEDKEVFPEEFELGVDMTGKVVQTPDNIRRSVEQDGEVPPKFLFGCDEAVFDTNGKKTKLEDFCPKKVKVYISPYGASNAVLHDLSDVSENGDIVLDNFSSPQTLISLLHEVGHVLDNKKKSIGQRLFMVNASVDRSRLGKMRTRNVTSEKERNAWANAIKISRKNNMGIEKNIRRKAQVALGTYQQIEDEIKTGARFTNKARQERRQITNCPKCGVEMPLDANFCGECGTNIATGEK